MTKNTKLYRPLVFSNQPLSDIHTFVGATIVNHNALYGALICLTHNRLQTISNIWLYIVDWQNNGNLWLIHYHCVFFIISSLPTVAITLLCPLD